MSSPKRVSKYELDPKFEMAIVLRECSSARFHAIVGHALESEAFNSPPAQMAVEAALAIAHETGNGPGNQTLVMQRLRRMMDEGKRMLDEVVAVNDLLDAADGSNPPSEDDTIRELVPMLKRRLEQRALNAAMEDFGARKDLGKAGEEMKRISRLGMDPMALGSMFGDGTRNAIERIRNLARLPTGILELDESIGGGLPRACFGFVIGGTGAGKSVFLASQLAHAQRMGLACALTTLELTEGVQAARILSNHTAIPIDEILGDRSEEAHRMIEEMNLGPCYIQEGVRTMGALRDWNNRCADKLGRKIDVTVVDYADKMKVPNQSARDRRNDVMLEVYDDLLQLAKDQDGWVWTASAAKVKDKSAKKKRLLDAEDAADSADKGRSADLVITLNPEDNKQLTFGVGKNRHGNAGQMIGPISTNFACGSITPNVGRQEAAPF